MAQESGSAQVWRKGGAAGAAEAREQSGEVERLAAKAASGERGALESLCAKVAKGVLARVRFLYRGGDAEDIAQEVLMRMCRHIHTLKDPGAFRAWMHSIVTNEVKRQHRGSGRYGNVLYLDECAEEPADEDDAGQPQEYVLREEESRVIMEIIDDFPERQREAVMLHYYDNMSVTDTAKAMELTHQSVTRHLSLARDKLRRELARRTGQAGGAMPGALALVPAGALIKQAMESLHTGLTPADSLWAAGAAAKALKGTPKAGAGAGAVAAVALWPKIAAGVAGVFAAAAVAAAVLAPKGPAPGTAQNPLPFPPQAEAAVVFTGGDERYAHLNPKEASAHVAEEQPYTPLGWAVSTLDGGETLQSGEGGAVSEPFATLPSGAYRLTFTLRNEEGHVYSMASNFQIGYGPGI